MHKVQLFQAENIQELQDKINQWLKENEAVYVVNSNITSLQTHAGERYVFYIFYEENTDAVAEVQEIVSNQEMDIDPLKIDINPQ